MALNPINSDSTQYDDVPLDLIENLATSLVEDHDGLLDALVAMREKHGLSQADVAFRMGVSQPTVAAFERYDANPTLATIRRYALAVRANIESRVVDACSDESRFDAIIRDNGAFTWDISDERALSYHVDLASAERRVTIDA